MLVDPNIKDRILPYALEAVGFWIIDILSPLVNKIESSTFPQNENE